MFYLNRLLSGRSLKTLALISCFLIIAAFIWYLGPFLGFGKTCPLEPVTPRIVFIALALLWFARFGWRIPLFVMVALTACVLLWVLGPYLLTGNHYPLADKLNRLTMIAVIVLITLIYGVWKLLVALSVDPQLLQNLIKFHRARPEAHNDVSEVAAVIRNAAQWTHKKHGSASLWRRFIFPKRPQAGLPWYLVIGREDAGKTSLIAASGQDFPLPEQLSRLGTHAVPTGHCECWFANDAMFIDTAGKFVSEGNTWQMQWSGLLNAVSKYRPVKALNGVIVAISAADLLGESQAALLDLAVTVRSRLAEIRTQLGVRFPVYVVLTKLDRLAGFEEYFRNLTAEGREQVWGVTFPYGEKNIPGEAGLQQRILRELQLLEMRLDDNMNLRQQEEYAVADRKRMYALPQDFRRLSQEIAQVVQNIFFASRYDETQHYTSLRGIYFASSTQSGELPLLNETTLIQRWRASFHAEDVASSAPDVSDEAEPLISSVAGGRQYFLRKLFADIIVKDAGLVRDNQNMAIRYRLRNIAGHCACVAVTVWLLNGLITSYHNNTRYLNSVSQNLQKLEHDTASFLKSTDAVLLPTLLNLSQTLPEFGTLDITSPDWRFRYGLYTGQKVSAQANSLYQFFLHRFLLPQVEQEAAKSLQDALGTGENAQIYDALKLYLMVSGEGKIDPQYMVPAIADRWEQSGKLRPYGDRSVLMAHLEQLFSQPDWRRDGIVPDPEMIKQARALLSRYSVTARIYARMKESLQADAPENLTLGIMTGSDVPQIFTLNDPQLLDNGVPGLFTYSGYHNVVKKKGLYRVTALWAEDQWVMGHADSRPEDAAKVNEAVLALYLREYRTYWSRFLADIRLVSVTPTPNEAPDFSEDIYMLRTLASGNSPLLSLAKELVRQTTLSTGDNPLSVSTNLVKMPRALNHAEKLEKALTPRERKIIAEGVDNAFSDLRAFVTGSGLSNTKNTDGQGIPGTQLSKMMGTLMDQYTLLVISSSAINQGDVSTVSGNSKVMSAQAQTWPDPFKNIVEPLLAGVYEKVDRQTIVVSQKSIDAGPGEICRNTLQGRYPFADADREASLSDIEHFFAKGGVADDYFQQKLADKVDTTASPWRYKGSSESESLRMFEQAAEIRRALFQDGEGKKLALHLALSVPYMSPTITQLTLHVEGNDFKYAHGPVVPMSFIWPGAHSGVSVSAMPRRVSLEQPEGDQETTSQVRIAGVWSLFQWLEKAQQIEESQGDSQIYSFPLDTRRVNIAISGLTYGDIPVIELLRDFKCPDPQ